MYAVIFWTTNPDAIHIIKNSDDSVWIAETLKEVDERAAKFESKTGLDCRVISLESAHE